MHTAKLLEYCNERGAILHSMDIQPLPEEGPWKDNPHIRFYRGHSIELFTQLPVLDAVLIDGDHNWYTVYNELKLIEKQAIAAGRFPLVFVHDIDWPYGRRDLYYDPESIPPEFRHEAKRGGVIQSRDMLSASEGINEHFMHATHENGPRNGVRTAICDFLEQTGLNLLFYEVPGLYGLGIVADGRIKHTKPALYEMLESLRNSHALYKVIRNVENERLEKQVLYEQAQRMLKNTSALETAPVATTENGQQNTTRHLEDKTTQILNREKEIQAVFLREKNTLVETIRSQMKHENEQQIAELHERVRKSDERLQHTQAILAHMRHTRSWRLTQPLRAAESFLKSQTEKWKMPILRYSRSEQKPAKHFYPQQLLERHTLTHEGWKESIARAAGLSSPRFTLVMHMHSFAEVLLREGLNSILEQTYGMWELIIYHHPEDLLGRAIIRDYMQLDPDRIRGVPLKGESRKIVLRDLLEHARGDYLIPVAQHDRLNLSMLERMATFCGEQTTPPDYILQSTDSITADGQRHSPAPITDGFGYLQTRPFYRGEAAVRIDFLRARLAARKKTDLQSIGTLYPHLNQAKVLVMPWILYHRLEQYS